MTELNGSENLSDLTSYFHQISKVKVAGTSISQFLGNEILEKFKAYVSQSSCGKCKCCTNITNALIDVQTKIVQSCEALYDNEIVGNSHMENERMEILSASTSKVVSNTTNNDTGSQKRKKQKPQKGRNKIWCLFRVSEQQKSRVVKPNTQKTPNRKPEPKDNGQKKVAEKQTNISVKKRQKTRDDRDLNSSRNLPSRSCTKNISYSSKIPTIRRPFDLQEKKKTTRRLPQKLNVSLDNKCLTHRAKKSKPRKKPYQQENIPEQVFCYKGSRSKNKVINVKGDNKQCQIYVKGTVPKKILTKLARTAGVGETIGSSFLKKYFSNSPLVNVKRRTLYSPSQWMSSSEFADMTFD